MRYQPSPEEKAFLDHYDIRQFDQPSLTVDIAVFAIQAGEDEDRDYRKDPPLELSLLMVRRGTYPYRDCWALPGGFAKPGESTLSCAERELKEETSVEKAYLRSFDLFSDAERDPRGWIISQGFLALVDAKDYRLRAGTDAWDARWFTIRLHDGGSRKKTAGKRIRSSKEYELELENRTLDITLTARIREEKVFDGFHEKTEYEIQKSSGFAFDHAKIILRAFLELRRQTQKDGMIVFDLMPETFTLNMLQEAHEIILDQKLLTPNFRRKTAPLVIETKESVSGAGHRPAKLFRRNPEAFCG